MTEADVEVGLQNAPLIAQICNALKTPERIRTLQLLSDDWTLNDVADEVDRAYATVHGYAEDLEEAKLVVVDDSGHRHVTDHGEYILQSIEEWDDNLGEAFRETFEEELDSLTSRALDMLTEEEARKLLEEKVQGLEFEETQTGGQARSDGG